MADVLRVVEFSAGGRPVEVLNLEQLGGAGNVTKEAGTFKFTAPQAKNVEARSPRRFGGSRTVAQSHENATIGARWLVKADTHDEALDQIARLLEVCNHALSGRYVEFRPDGTSVSRSTFSEVRGPATWDGDYKWVEFFQGRMALFALTFPVAPLPELHRMDIRDDYDDPTTLVDYTLAGGSPTPAISSSAIRGGANLTADYFFLHTGRGHRAEDRQVLLQCVQGAAGTGGNIVINYAIPKGVDEQNFVYVRAFDDGTTRQIRFGRYLAGSNGLLTGTTTITFPATGTAWWLRVRLEGAVLTADYFNQTAQPGPMATPTTTSQITLTSAELTAFGPGVGGFGGGGFRPQHANTRIATFIDEPYTYVNQSLPKVLQLGGPIPGTAPSKVDAVITPSGGSAPPVWGMLGWAQRPTSGGTGAGAPFGIIPAESASSVTGWAVSADANYRNGSGLKVTASGAGSASAQWTVDPSILAADEFSLQELLIEFWARIDLASTLVSPKLTLSARPGAGTNFGAERFTGEWQAAGKLLTLPSSGSRFRQVRLGTLLMAVDLASPVSWIVRLAGSWAAGSSGNFGLDELYPVVAAQRAAGPTGRVNDATYPKFVASTSETRKRIRSDLSGLTASGAANPFPDAGLSSGSPLEFPAGPVDALVELSSLVPDDPTIDTSSEQQAHNATVHFSVVPRVHFVNGS